MSKERLKERVSKITELARTFCVEKLDDEHFELAEKGPVHYYGEKKRFGLRELYMLSDKTTSYTTNHLNLILLLMI